MVPWIPAINQPGVDQDLAFVFGAFYNGWNQIEGSSAFQQVNGSCERRERGMLFPDALPARLHVSRRFENTKIDALIVTFPIGIAQRRGCCSEHGTDQQFALVIGIIDRPFNMFRYCSLAMIVESGIGKLTPKFVTCNDMIKDTHKKVTYLGELNYYSDNGGCQKRATYVTNHV